MSATPPPTAPPTIAPMFVLEPEELEFPVPLVIDGLGSPVPLVPDEVGSASPLRKVSVVGGSV